MSILPWTLGRIGDKTEHVSALRLLLINTAKVRDRLQIWLPKKQRLWTMRCVAVSHSVCAIVVIDMKKPRTRVRSTYWIGISASMSVKSEPVFTYNRSFNLRTPDLAGFLASLFFS